MRKAALALALAACGTFEDPAIVIDLRILATTADPPEQLIPIDPNNPPDPSTIALVPVELCTLIAEPGIDRPLASQMTTSSGSSSRSTPSRVVSFSPGWARRTTTSPDNLLASHACSGWPSSNIT